MSDEFNDLFDNAPCGYVVFGDDGTIKRANRTLARLIDADPDAVLGARISQLFAAGSRLLYETHLHPLLVVNGMVSEVALDLKSRDGVKIPILMSVVEAPSATPERRDFRAMMIDVTERRRIEDELRTARRLAEQRAQRLAALQQISARLAVAVGPDDVAVAIASSAQAALDVDTIVLWRLDAADGRLHPIAQSGADQHLVVAPFDRTAIRPHWVALDSGETVTIGEDDGDRFADTVGAMLTAGHRTVRFIPFQIGSEPGGIVSMGFIEPARLDADDEALLAEVVAQGAAALERAELYAQQRAIALTWQASLMAHSIPEDDRLRIQSYYAPATTSFGAGGDWFDVVCVDDDRIGLIVGDVVGKGMAAAAVMGQLRSAATAMAQAGFGPSAVLESLDRFARTIPGAIGATVLCVEVDLTSGVALVARAGHPPPLVRTVRGSRFVEEHCGPPLAVVDALRPEPAEVPLAALDRLVLYTDGLIERRGESLDVGLARLARIYDEATDEPIDHLVTASATNEHGDDICVLDVTLIGDPRPAGSDD